MNLGATITRRLPLLQAQAETRMTDAGTITRTGKPGKPDPVTGKVTTNDTTVYSGKARVRPLSRVTQGEVNAGDAADSDTVYIIGLPHGTAGVKPGDIWVTTKSADPAVRTLKLRVLSIEAKDQATEQRLVCSDIARRKP